MEYNVGDKVEVGSKLEGFKGSFYEATVIKKRTRRSYVVEYETLLNDDDYQPYTEIVPIRMIRPIPPLWRRTFLKYDVVDAYDHDGWWEGEVVEKTEDQYTVYFKEYDIKRSYTGDQLRVHFDWAKGSWIAS